VTSPSSSYDDTPRIQARIDNAELIEDEQLHFATTLQITAKSRGGFIRRCRITYTADPAINVLEEYFEAGADRIVPVADCMLTRIDKGFEMTPNGVNIGRL
jgi:hypothetical protein